MEKLSPMPLGTFLDVNQENIVRCLAAQRGLTAALASAATPDVYRFLDCPNLKVSLCTVEQTVIVLNKTKSSFKSTELRDLRGQLDALLADMKSIG